MRHFFTILSHEIRMLLINPSTYIAGFFFLAVMGFIFTVLLGQYSHIPQEGSPVLAFFTHFWVPVFFIVPLLTMKCISEERRTGTLETLLTTPVSTTEVVLGKYFACYFLYITLWASTLGFFFLLYHYSNDARFFDRGTLEGAYLFIALSGLLFVALGIFGSAISRNQAIAAIASFALLFVTIIGVGFLTSSPALNAHSLLPLKAALNYAQILQHLDDFCRGMVDLQQVFFYLTGSIFTLILSILAVEAKLLHS